MTQTAENNPPSGGLQAVTDLAGKLRTNLRSVIEGKDVVIDDVITVLLAGGHLLVEDVPGVGKTVLAKALAKSIGASTNRIQFTPDLLPSDITGVSIYNQQSRDFEFREGAVFANIIIGDEINRASPKTQAALLEAMEEQQVTIDGETRELPAPFMVVATQNPIDMDGTFPLPEAQRDRFMAQVSMGYPSPEAEFDMLNSHGTSDPLSSITPVATIDEVTNAINSCANLHTSDALKQYVVDLVTATRDHQATRFGASPRATLQLLRAARAHAALSGRGHTIPEDVTAMAIPVLTHRLILSRTASLTPTDVLLQIIDDVVVPTARRTA